jgi:FkbM family methyltransferase
VQIKTLPAFVYTNIPGRQPIELVAYYPEFLGYYENCELETKRWCVENVQPDWVILDCGANIGYYTILFSQLAPQGQVYAIEPTTTVEMLKQNLAHNHAQNATTWQIAFGKTSGIVRDGIFRIWGNEAEVQEYPFLTLDDFVAQHAIARVDCVKIDVDSYDFEVLQGAAKTLERFNPWVIVELNHALNRRNQNNMQALEWLAAHGYTEALVLDYDNFILRKAQRDAGRQTQSHTITLKWKI